MGGGGSAATGELVITDDLLDHVVYGDHLHSFFSTVRYRRKPYLGGRRRGVAKGATRRGMALAREIGRKRGGEIKLTAVLVVICSVPANPIEASVRIGEEGSVSDSVGGVVHHGLWVQHNDVVCIYSPHVPSVSYAAQERA